MAKKKETILHCSLGKDKGRWRKRFQPQNSTRLVWEERGGGTGHAKQGEKLTRADLSNLIPRPLRERWAQSTSSAEHSWGSPTPFPSPAAESLWLHCTDWRWHQKSELPATKWERHELLAGGCESSWNISSSWNSEEDRSWKVSGKPNVRKTNKCTTHHY